MNNARLLVVCVALLYAVQALQNPLNTAICPPTAWISCSPEPPNPLVCAGSAAYCCWVGAPETVASELGADPIPNWVSTNFHPTLEYAPTTFGTDLTLSDTTVPVLEIEYDSITLLVSSLTCNYVQQTHCAGTNAEQTSPRTLFSLVSTVPFRYQVPAVYNEFVQSLIAPGPSACADPSADPELLYRCCLWDGGLPSGFTKPKSTPLRTFSCKAPGVVPIDPPTACSAVVARENECGDVGSCYCRLQYAPHTPAENREPWDCGGCCAPLSGMLDRDYRLGLNLTRTNCLAQEFDEPPSRDFCLVRELFSPPPPAPSPSAATLLNRPSMLIIFVISSVICAMATIIKQ